MTREEFKKLFDSYFEDVRRYVLYRCGDGDLATDITQDVFMKIWEKQMQIEPKTAKNLLIKIAGDLVVSRFRREKVAYKFFDTWQPGEISLSPEEELNYGELKAAYAAALESMPEKQRAVFLMNRIDELKYREIADQLGLSVKAVEKRMSQALQFLKDHLQTSFTRIILFFMNGGFSKISRT